MSHVDRLLKDYGSLMSEVDAWFSRCAQLMPEAIACHQGCSGCCRGLFDITLLDACFLKSGFDRLPTEVRQSVIGRAYERVEGLRTIWPDFVAPYLLNYRSDEEWEDLMPEDDETSCVLFGSDDNCLVYDHRPMTCRLHGLPLIDWSGEIMDEDWCSLNFVDVDPIGMVELRGEFKRFFRAELSLFREFTVQLINHPLNELDTFIPTALLIDFGGFDWRQWWEQKQVKTGSQLEG